MRHSKNDPKATTPSIDSALIQNYIDTTLQTQLTAFKNEMLNEIRACLAPPVAMIEIDCKDIAFRIPPTLEAPPATPADNVIHEYTAAIAPPVENSWDGPIATVEAEEAPAVPETHKVSYRLNVQFDMENDEAELYMKNPHVQQMFQILSEQSRSFIDFTQDCPFSKEQIEPYSAFMFLKCIRFTRLDIEGIHPLLLDPNKTFEVINPHDAEHLLMGGVSNEPIEPPIPEAPPEPAPEMTKAERLVHRVDELGSLIEDAGAVGMADKQYMDSFNLLTRTINAIRVQLTQNPSESDACLMRIDSAIDSLWAVANKIFEVEKQMVDVTNALREILNNPAL